MRWLATPLGHFVAAICLQAVAAGILFGASELAYGQETRRLSAALERPVGLVVLALAGFVAGALAVRGLYRLHLCRPTWVAALGTVPYLAPLMVACVSIRGFVLIA